MTQDEIIEMVMQIGGCDRPEDDSPALKMFVTFAKLVEDKKQNDIEILYALYEQASAQRGVLMEQQKEMILKIRDANEIIFKSCVNLPHWKRTAMRYLKRNAPQAHQLAVNEFNEHPDGRGKE